MSMSDLANKLIGNEEARQLAFDSCCVRTELVASISRIIIASLFWNLKNLRNRKW